MVIAEVAITVRFAATPDIVVETCAINTCGLVDTYAVAFACAALANTCAELCYSIC